MAETEKTNSILGEVSRADNFKNRMKSPPRKRIVDQRELDAALKVTAARSERIAKVSEERRRLWDALNEYVRQQGAAITSTPYGTPVRLEIITENSPLPGLLQQHGYNPYHAGQITRVTSSGITTAQVIVFDFPGSEPQPLWRKAQP